MWCLIYLEHIEQIEAYSHSRPLMNRYSIKEELKNLLKSSFMLMLAADNCKTTSGSMLWKCNKHSSILLGSLPLQQRHTRVPSFSPFQVILVFSGKMSIAGSKTSVRGREYDKGLLYKTQKQNQYTTF